MANAADVGRAQGRTADWTESTLPSHSAALRCNPAADDPGMDEPYPAGPRLECEK
ncbi:hypothetical protein FRAAL0493 [Frankia alni ACN14a]|uniref:Uncharacterized protein n=1 Tax=Frankia alni (strain DSM 45986 / CECT 9034 / ACN14a) TaxID=326424 RepID=Q0RTD3_FRAAA|nr:hypothetical protein FRAAL0493 [Frankia alni ACN14a]